METAKHNREVIGTLGDLVENLCNEVAPLPITDVTKKTMVMVMIANCLKINGDIVTLSLPNFMPGQ